MNIPSEFWTVAREFIQGIGIPITGLIVYLIKRRVDQIQKVVDGPLSVQTAKVADLTLELAEIRQLFAKLTGDHVDLKNANIATREALDAKAINENRIAGIESTIKNPGNIIVEKPS